jgi:hypothetical protein
MHSYWPLDTDSSVRYRAYVINNFGGPSVSARYPHAKARADLEPSTPAEPFFDSFAAEACERLAGRAPRSGVQTSVSSAYEHDSRNGVPLLLSNIEPMIGAGSGKRIARPSALPLRHERRRHREGWPVRGDEAKSGNNLSVMT